jgi:hypothetical protein
MQLFKIEFFYIADAANVLKKPGNFCLIFLLCSVFFSFKADAQRHSDGKVNYTMEFPLISDVKVDGVLGQAIENSISGRLKTLPGWNEGELINMFSLESRLSNTTNDWYGEHAGKWLITSSRAAYRSGDRELKDILLKTADYLISTQEHNGYLGTYSPQRRITNHQSLTHASSWDVWNMSYMILGLLEVNKYYPAERYLIASKKIGDLFLENFSDGGQRVTEFGTRRGISATVILDPMVELFRVTGDKRYLDYLDLVIRQMEEKEGLQLISAALANRDLEWIGDGKIYQLLWNITAVAKLYQVTGNVEYLKAAENIWNKVRNFHLTIIGGPWGGIGKHKECFNSRGYWSPYGYTETCSVMSWIQFNSEMFKLTGKAIYVQEVEKSVYNTLLGAQFPNGMDWAYHTFSNGVLHKANFNDCCPSSGALALEELPPLIYTTTDRGIACNLYSESSASVHIPGVGVIKINQETEYPFEGSVRISVRPENVAFFQVLLRIPDWAEGATVKVNCKIIDASLIIPGDYLVIERKWQDGDIIDLHFPMKLNVIRQTEVSMAPQRGGSIYQVHWFALTRGPLIYCINGLIGSAEREEIFPLPANDPETLFTSVTAPKGVKGEAYELKIPEKPPLVFIPFLESGEGISGTWRLTWIQEKIR